MSGDVLDGVDPSNANLTGVSSGGVSGSGYTLPTNWTLVDGDNNAPGDGYLIGPGSNLEYANLSGAT